MAYQTSRASIAHAPNMHWQATRPPHDGDRVAAAARWFYMEMLDGQQIWPKRRAGAPRGLWFLVGTTLLEATGADPLPVVIEVDAPEEVAERCWDAGFVVHARDEADGACILSVMDPFGRQIDLAPAVPAEHAAAGRG